MGQSKKAKVLRIYLDENLKSDGELLYRAILKKWMELKMTGATVFKAVEGFGASAHIHDAGILEISENLPMVVEMVDEPARVKKALLAIEKLLPAHGLVTLQDIQVLHMIRPSKKRKK